MTFVTLTPIIGPSYPVARKITPKLITTNFGNGYKQVVPDGLNYQRDAATLQWINASQAEHDYLFNFQAALLGYLPFFYTIPHDPAAKLWEWPIWDAKEKESGYYDIQAAIAQRFDLTD